MFIDQEKCIRCESCIVHCPVKAIEVIEDGRVDINQDTCVECNNCVRTGICPTDAFEVPVLTWPRQVRNLFSDPVSIHPTTNSGGRGTEEVKTNDVTGLIKYGQAGFALDVGRPIMGTTFKDIEKLTMALATLPYVEYAPISPVTHYFADKEKGKIREDILEERVLTAIIEFIVPVEKMQETIEAIQEAAKLIDTVFSMGVFLAAGPEGELPSLDFFSDLGLPVGLGGKTNLGLGKS